MMEIALALLLMALGLVIYHERDFWFPDAAESQEADASPAEHTPGAAPANVSTGSSAGAKGSAMKSKPPLLAENARNGAPRSRTNTSGSNKSREHRSRANNLTPATAPASALGDTAVAGAGFAASAQRTVLPPLEVEVVAGDVHRTVRPGSNSVRVDVQPGSPTQAIAEPAASSAASDTAAAVTRRAAERVEMSTDASAVVSSSVKPDYPLLARQMKVQGSVILQALIGRDGAIQDLHVMSGPPILAGAAREAVRQWRFKPHYQGVDSVETQAKITVNFTISTN
jgi:TonB family protein